MLPTPPPGTIHVAAILGSIRPGNYTAKALALVADEFSKHPEIAFDLIDPAKMQLPFPGQEGTFEDARTLRGTVLHATGVIIATPEYHGSFSSITKLVIENLGFPSALAGKPITLLGVAGGVIGAIKSLEALASVCSHVGGHVLPGAVSIPNVQQAFDAEGKVRDAGTERRIRSVATNLIDYIHDRICPKLALEAMVRSK